jgi:capsular exopolysaccharide synthesis family protein
MLGESKYIEGGVGLIETEKNLYNEIAILKSYSLIEQALKSLPFGVSYHTRKGLQTQEHYGYFPIIVSTAKDSAQSYGALFEVELIGKDKFRLILEAEEFVVSNPVTRTTREMKEGFDFSKNYSFGDEVIHPYFHFTIDKPDYEVNPDDFTNRRLFFQLHSLSGLANHYYDRLKVEQVDIQASIMTLNIIGQSPEKEIDFLNSLSKSFINRELNQRNEIAASKEAFIREQLESISDSLSRAESKLQQFKQGANAVDLTRTATNTLDQLQRLETEKGQLSVNLKYYQSLLQYINDSEAIDKIVAPSVAGINDPLLSENLLELKRLNTEKTRLEFYKGAKSYDLVLIKEQLQNTRNALKENIKNLISTETLQLNDRNQRIARLESTISQLPVNEQRLVNYERDNTLYGNMYNYLNQELAKTAIARAEDITDTKIVDKPRQVGDGPVTPQKLLIMALAFILGLFIPLLGIIFSDQSLENIQKAGYLKDYSSIPLLHKVGSFNSALATLANYKSDWVKDETFRSLGANLQFLVSNPNQNVIGFTSYGQGEGKTFCALHLAANYAKSGKKTLLLDMNYRIPRLFKGINMQDKIDLKSYLLDPSIGAEKITLEHKLVPNLHYIPTRNAENNPHQILTNARLKTLIAALKHEYDYVIVDAPAIGLVADYLLIAPQMDINMFVVRKGRVKLKQLDELETLVQNGDMKNAFIIFNDAGKKVNPTPNYSDETVTNSEKKLIKWPSFKRSVS